MSPSVDLAFVTDIDGLSFTVDNRQYQVSFVLGTSVRTVPIFDLQTFYQHHTRPRAAPTASCRTVIRRCATCRLHMSGRHELHVFPLLFTDTRQSSTVSPLPFLDGEPVFTCTFSAGHTRNKKRNTAKEQACAQKTPRIENHIY